MSALPSWMAELNQQTAATVASELDLSVRGPLSTCPSCGAEQRSRSDERLPVVLDGQVWHCKACDVGGGLLDLVALVDFKRKWSALQREEQHAVRAYCAERQWCAAWEGRQAIRPTGRQRRRGAARPVDKPREPAPAEPLSRPPIDELTAVWGSGSSHRDVWYQDHVHGFLRARKDAACGYLPDDVQGFLWPDGLEAVGVCRVLPDTPSGVSWWPSHWRLHYRLACLAYEADGTAASLHARSLDPKSKTRWPLGHKAGRLFLTGPRGAAFLRGELEQAPEAVWITEGLTDTLSAHLAAHAQSMNVVVLGGTQGTYQALSRVQWPEAVKAGRAPVYVMTDTDEQGEKYAEQIRKALDAAGIPRGRRMQWDSK